MTSTVKREHDESTVSTRNEARDFIANTTAHGLKLIFETNANAIRRGFWAVLFLTSLAIMSYMIYGAYLDISQHPFTTVYSLNLSSPLPFPSLTVCNLQTVNLSALPSNLTHLSGLLPSRLFSDALSALTGGLMLPTPAPNPSKPPDTPSDKYAENDTLTHERTFFTSCQYGGQTLNCSDIFSEELQMDRICYVLKANDLSPGTRRTALKLTIFINPVGYMSKADTSGVTFHVHESGSSQDMTIPRHEAPTGFTTNVGVRIYEYQFLPLPYKAFGEASCTDTETEDFRSLMEGDPELYPGSSRSGYSLASCMAAKARDIAARACNCTAQGNQMFFGCPLSQYTGCYKDAVQEVLDRATASDFLQCPRSCHTYSYVPTISLSYFPSPSAFDSLRRKGAPGNVSDIRSGYLQLKIYMEELIIHKTEHVPKYEWISIMGLIGGNMGFFVGASVLTLAEVLDFFICVLLLCSGKLLHKLPSPRSNAVNKMEAPRGGRSEKRAS